MITEIKKGDVFQCTSLVPNCGSVEKSLYTPGKEYTSLEDGVLCSDNDGYGGSWTDFDKFNRHFIKVNKKPNTFKPKPQKNWNDIDMSPSHFECAECERETLVSKRTLSMPNVCADCTDSHKEIPEKLIRRFPSGAVRSDDTGRPKPAWISPYFAEQVSMVMVDNENDFGACNYMLGIDELAGLDSLVRHVGELQEAMLITKDAEATKKVARAVGFNILALIHTIVLKEKGLYKKVFEKTELVTVEEAKKGVNFVDKK